MRFSNPPRRARLLVLVAASLIGTGAGLVAIGGGPVAAQETSTTTTTEAPTTTTTTAPTTTTTAPTTTTTRPRTTTTTRPRTTTTTRAQSTTTSEAPTTTSSTATSTTSTTAAPAAVAPPGFSTPDDDTGGDGGGWSTDTKIALVLGGLLVVAAGLSALAVAYWRGTRPVAVDEELAAGDADAASPTGPVTTASSEAAGGLDLDVLAGAAVGAGTAAGAPSAGRGASLPADDPLLLLLAGHEGAAPGAAPSAGEAAPASGPAPAPAQSSGVRVIGPAEPAAEAAPAPAPASPTATGQPDPDGGFRLVTREDLEAPGPSEA